MDYLPNTTNNRFNEPIVHTVTDNREVIHLNPTLAQSLDNPFWNQKPFNPKHFHPSMLPNTPNNFPNLSENLTTPHYFDKPFVMEEWTDSKAERPHGVWTAYREPHKFNWPPNILYQPVEKQQRPTSQHSKASGFPIPPPSLAPLNPIPQQSVRRQEPLNRVQSFRNSENFQNPQPVRSSTFLNPSAKPFEPPHQPIPSQEPSGPPSSAATSEQQSSDDEGDSEVKMKPVRRRVSEGDKPSNFKNWNNAEDQAERERMDFLSKRRRDMLDEQQAKREKDLQERARYHAEENKILRARVKFLEGLIPLQNRSDTIYRSGDPSFHGQPSRPDMNTINPPSLGASFVGQPLQPNINTINAPPQDASFVSQPPQPYMNTAHPTFGNTGSLTQHPQPHTPVGSVSTGVSNSSLRYPRTPSPGLGRRRRRWQKTVYPISRRIDC